MKIFGSDNYGGYSLLFAQCNLIVAISFGWLNQAQLRYYSKDRTNNNYNIIQFRAIFYCVILSLLILSIFIFFQSLSVTVFVLSTITIISIGIFNYIKTLYQTKFFPKKIIYLTAIQSLLALFFPILLLLFFEREETTILFGVGLSFLVVLVSIIIKNKNSFFSFFLKRKILKKSNSVLKRWFLFGSPLSIWFAIGLSLPFFDRFFINIYFSSSDLGVYSSLQELLTRLFSLILFPLMMALHPRIMKIWNQSNYKEAIKIILHSFYAILIIGLIMLLLFIQFENFIYELIKRAIPNLSNEYYPLIFPLLITGFLWQLSFLTHKMLELKEKTFLMIIAIIPSLIINIIGNIIFLPTVGVIATAYSALLSALCYCLITAFYSIYSIYSINKLKFA